jgi:hypothetical protein
VSHPNVLVAGSCLSAPAEVSAWTKFCEVELPDATKKILKMLNEEGGGGGAALILPVELSKFEAHLRQPVRIHNIRKKMAKTHKLKDLNGSTKHWKGGTNGAKKEDPIKAFARENHIFAEGK